MIHFVVAFGTEERVDFLAPRLVPALERTRLFDGETVAVRAPGGGWAAAAILVPDPFARARLHADGDALAILNGVATPHGGRSDSLLQQISARFVTGGTAAVAAELDGSYNFVGISPTGGLRAFADFSGLFPLYWREARGAVLFSNRPSTLATAAGEPAWDLAAMAWLIGHSNLFGDRLPADEVRYLVPGHEAEVTSERARVVVRRSPEWSWPGPDGPSLRENLTPAEWDDVTDLLVGNLRRLRNAGAIRLMLSGGKDSRLCLALAKAAGLRDVLTCVTNGEARSPELLCAAAAARAVGFPHVRGAFPPFVGGGPGSRVAYEWRRLHQHVYRFEAMICPRDGKSDEVVSTTVNVKGFGGELYRGPGGHAKQFRRRLATTVEEMADRFVHYHQRHDPLGVLSEGQRELQAGWLRRWVHDAARDVRLDVLPERFFVDYRLGHWNGPLLQWTPLDIQVNPLLSRAVAATYLELRPEVRATDRLHYEVMRRTAPELLEVPLVNDVWAPPIAAESDVALPTHPFPADRPVTTRALRPGRWRFLEEAGVEVANLVDDAARSTDMGAVCDLARLRAIAGSPEDLKSIEVKAIESSIAIAIALLGRAEPVRDSPG